MQGKLHIGTIGGATSTILLEEMPELEIAETAADEIAQTVFLVTGEPIEITVEAKIDKLALLSILTGVKVTNNWLKLHGGIMRRKRWISNG